MNRNQQQAVIAAARQIAEEAEGAADRARSCGLSTLAYLLDMVVIEARQIERTSGR